MKRYLVLLALPALVACGDAADESDDPPAAETELTAGAPADTATASTPDPALTQPVTAAPAASDASSPPAAAATSGRTTLVPPTNQDAQYQDSVTEPPEVAP